MAKHSLIYGLGNMLNKVVGFLMIPIYTRFLVPAEYGKLELVVLTTEILGMFISMRISRAMYRFYFEYDRQEEKDAVVSTAFLFFGAIGLVGIGMASLFAERLAAHLLDSAVYRNYFIIAFVSLWFNTLLMLGTQYLQIQKQSLKYITVSAFQLIISLSFNVYFVVLMELGVLGVLLGNMIGAITVAVITSVAVLSKVGLRFSIKTLKEMLRFGLPLVPGALANFAVLVSDRYFVKVFGSLTHTGIYSLSCKFGVLPHTFVTIPFFQIWSVRRFELMKSATAEETMGRVITYFLLVITYIGLGLSVLCKDVIQIIADPKYWDSHRYIPLLVLSYIIFGLYNHFSISILIHKKTKYISYIDLSNGAINVLLNIVFIQRYGIFGAVYATLISYTLRIAVLYIVSNRIQKIYFEFGRAAKVLITAALIYVVSIFIDSGSTITNLFLKGLLLTTWPAVLFCSNFFNPGERANLRSILTYQKLRTLISK
jgi:O-antigen/teichoic acid export membrane protein